VTSIVSEVAAKSIFPRQVDFSKEVVVHQADGSDGNGSEGLHNQM
jgi:hypothetical protein